MFALNFESEFYLDISKFKLRSQNDDGVINT